MKIMLKLLYFIFVFKFNSFLKKEGAYLIILFRILYLINVVFSVFLSSLILEASSKNKFSLATNQIIVVIHLIIFVIILFRNIFPFYKFKISLFNKNHPLSVKKKLIIDLLNQLLTPIFFNAFCFTLLFYLSSDLYALLDLQIAILLIFIALLNENNLKLLVEGYQVKKIFFVFIYLFMWVLFAFSTTFYFFKLTPIVFYVSYLYIHLLLEFSLLLKLSKQTLNNTKNSELKITYSYSLSDFFRKIIWRRKNTRTVVIVAFGVKIIILLLSTVNFYKHFMSVFASDALEVLFWFFLTPILVFNYFSNNFFGFLREYYLNIQKTTYQLRRLKQVYLSGLSNLLVLDFLISFVVTLSINKLSILSIAYYVALTILFITVGFAGSLLKPLLVVAPFKASKMTGSIANTSEFISISMFIINAILILMIDKVYFLWAALGISTISIIIFSKLKSSRYFSYKIYTKLFNT